MSKQTLWSRLNLGWPVAEALTTPVGAWRPSRRPPRPAKNPYAATIAPTIMGPAIACGGTWVPAKQWIATTERSAS